MKSIVLSLVILLLHHSSYSQLKWIRVDSVFGPLPKSVHVYKTIDSLDGKPNIAYYVEADIKDRDLQFDVDTTYKRRLTPSAFFARNDKAVVVVNTTFFSFATNQNLNVVIDEEKIVGYNIHTLPGRGKDTLTYRHPLGSAIGISNKREADIAWLYTDSTLKYPYHHQGPLKPVKDSLHGFNLEAARRAILSDTPSDKKPKFSGEWKMNTAVGGGPVLIQNGQISISNNEELKFAGKAIDDKHPRTAMGYTKEGKLIILVIEGRNAGKAEGATLTQEAQMLKDIGCWEALNLDGGGSSCLLVNGKETIRVSDPTGQRPVPAVFLIRKVK